MKKQLSICLLSLTTFSFANAQNLFVAGGNGNIYEFTPGGVQSTFATGVYGDGLAFNSAGGLFVSEPGNNAIAEITAGGAVSTFASGLNFPTGLAINNAGDLFVADQGSGNIYEFTPTGAQSTFATGLSSPDALAFDSAGNLFVAEAGNGAISEYTPGGVGSTFVPPEGIGQFVRGMAFNTAGNLFVAYDTLDGMPWGPNVVEWTTGPSPTPTGFGPGTTDDFGLAFDNAGNLFVSSSDAYVDPYNHIYELAPNGTQTSFASGLDGAEGMAFQPVPEPSAWTMLATSGLTMILFIRKR